MGHERKPDHLPTVWRLTPTRLATSMSYQPSGARHPRFHLHFTPTYSSWLNLIERWFAELTNKWLRRGTHRSTKELESAITAWVDNWNDEPKPFVWHKTADEILDTLAAYCQRISDSGH